MSKEKILEQAHHTFKQDLPELLEKHPRKWVAYYGTRQLGFGNSKAELMEEFIRMVQPDIPLQG